MTIDSNIDEKIQIIVKGCTRMDANSRLTIDKILQSDYFDQNRPQNKAIIHSLIKNKYFTCPKVNNNISLASHEQMQKNPEWKANFFF